MSCLLPIRNSYAQSCYCVYPNNDGRCYANTTCWACAPGAYDSNWQSNYCTGYQAPAPAPVTCTSSFIEKTEACPANYSGLKRYKQETKTCTDGQITVYPWQLYSDTCVQNPPTCQTSSQTQTLSCPTGYTGAITQSQTSTCPDPYGSPVWSAWVTTSNTCVKSLSNPTNPTSPVSPVNPASPMNQTTTVNVTPGAPVANASMDATGSATATETAPALTTSSSPTASTKTESSQSTTTSKESPPPSSGVKGKLNIGGLGQALSLELFVKPGIQQPNVFPDVSINQSIPKEMRINNDFLMELLNQPLENQADKLKRMAGETVEYDQ